MLGERCPAIRFAFFTTALEKQTQTHKYLRHPHRDKGQTFPRLTREKPRKKNSSIIFEISIKRVYLNGKGKLGNCKGEKSYLEAKIKLKEIFKGLKRSSGNRKPS